ncbi:hypothetical protein C7T35_33390 [Variovorax sp. WS11]|uniref:adenylate/guanylate cyclase domain-containing protein n=1 Tax=Variovorax sp. WS11 TaxID=1105204 RepID=UPI000D0DB57A|nr:adenylate/guanylate cyclase domain-containing protein [Variovorax sp. WS11]NDZ16733.1 hypothetical protein [Variovorax sp. WS11]PSL80230.1 hypothetical protein C7T35_33390 [Variovorax sp. WS11]
MGPATDEKIVAFDLAQGLSCLLRRQRVILVADLVESVRLLMQDEANAVQRWRCFVDKIQSSVLPESSGRLVKSLGDGVLAEFNDVPAAASAAVAMHSEIARLSQGCPSDTSMWLRIGIHIADVFVDTLDVYGAGVNLAARLAGLAGPGETVISADARDRVVDGLHGELEDLGECYLKHIPQPMRAFRLHARGFDRVSARPSSTEHHAILAVVPFALVPPHPAMNVISEALAEHIIVGLSGLTSLQLISRLSTSPLCNSVDPVHDSRVLLRANFVLTGHCALRGTDMTARCSLTEVAGGEVLWQGTYHSSIDELFGFEGGFVPDLVAHVGRAVVRREVKRSKRLPLPSLENYALYIGGNSLMHRMAEDDFALARRLFEQLEHRLPRTAAPKAMLAKWHLMRQLQGWSRQTTNDGRMAQDFARRALDQDPEHGFALATEAFVSAYMDADLPHARQGCLRALELDPQEAQCWRMAAGVHSYFGDGVAAESCAERALALTPLDPTRFIYELVLGAAKLACGKYGEAVTLAESSLRRNAMHVPTHRLRVIALSMAGRDVEAIGAAHALLTLSPGFSVNDFERWYPGRNQSHAPEYFAALRRAGLPG